MTTKDLLSQTVTAVEATNALAGAIVYWRLTSGTDGDTLARELEDRGIDPESAPQLPSPPQALTRAMNRATRELGCFPRRHAGAVYAVAQDASGDDPTFEAAWGVSLDPVGRPSFRGDQVDAQVVVVDSRMVSIRELVRDYYLAELDTLTTTDISSWLLRECEAAFALSLRDTGGVYFIGRDALDSFALRVEALHAASECKVHLVPAMHSSTAMDAFIDALIDEVASFVATTAEELGGEQLGIRAIDNRTAKIKRMSLKVERYEELLGTKLDTLRLGLLQLDGVAVAAALAAMPEADD